MLRQIPHELVEELKAILNQNKSHEREDEVWYHCPFHEDEHASMHVNYVLGVWYCFACAPTGYEATLWGLYEKLTGRRWNEPEETEPTFANLQEFLLYCHQKLIASPLYNILKNERVLSDNVINDSMLGLWQDRSGQYWLLIPITDWSGEVVRVKARRLNNDLTFSSGNPRYIFMTSSYHPLFPDEQMLYLYPLHLVTRYEKDVVLLTGGELDALAALSAGYFAIAPTSGETSVRRRETLELLGKIVEGRTLIIALDNEPEVQRVVPQLAQLLSQHADCVLLLPPSVYEAIPNAKDVTDLCRANAIHDALLQVVPFIPHEQASRSIVVYRKDDGYYYKKVERRRNEVIWSPEVKFVDQVRFYPKRRLIYLEGLHYKSEAGFEYLLCDIQTPSVLLQDCLLPISMFGDAGLRQKWLSQYSLSPYFLSHKSDIMHAFLNFLIRKVPTDRVTHRIGLQKIDDEWFYTFPSITFPKQTVRWFGDKNPMFDVRPEEPQPDELILVADMASLLLKLHHPVVMVKLLSMTHASALAPFVRQVKQKFPASFIFGYMGSGKTTLAVDVVMALLGAPRVIRLAVTQTESTIRKYADIFVSIPLIFDEFTPDRHDPSLLQNVKLFIHACYDGSVKQVSRSALEFERPQFAYSPLWIIGETNSWIMAEGALRERVYQIPIPRPPLRDEVMIYNKYLSFLDAGIHRKYAYCFYTWVLAKGEQEWEKIWREAEKIAREHSDLIPVTVTERIVMMFTVAVFGWLLWSRFMKEVLDLDVMNLREGLDEGYVIQALVPFFGQTYVTSRIERMVIQLNDFIETGDAIRGEHYEIKDKCLYIVITKTLQLLQKFYRRLWEYVDRSTLIADAQNMVRDTSCNFITGIDKVERIGGKPQRCMVIDINLFEQFTGYKLDAIRDILSGNHQQTLSDQLDVF